SMPPERADRMLRALRRRCAGPTLRILVIGVEGTEPTPSVHPSGEPEEPTGVQFPGLQHTADQAALGLRHGGRGDGLGPACGRGSGEEVVRVRAVQSVVPAAGFAWLPGGSHAGRRARCRRSLRRPRDLREWEHAVIRAPGNYAGPGKL